MGGKQFEYTKKRKRGIATGEPPHHQNVFVRKKCISLELNLRGAGCNGKVQEGVPAGLPAPVRDG
jgi:hypothetical protein